MDTTTAKRDFLFDNYKAVLIVLVIMGHFTDLNYGNNAFLYNLKWISMCIFGVALISTICGSAEKRNSGRCGGSSRR